MDQHSGAASTEARFESVGRLHGTSIEDDTQPLLFYPAHGPVLFGSFTDTTCSICTEEVGFPTNVDGADPNTGEEWTMLPCGHAFHMLCLATLCLGSYGSQRGHPCPECRVPIPPDYCEAAESWSPPLTDSWAARMRRNLRSQYLKQFRESGVIVSRDQMSAHFRKHLRQARERDERANQAHETAVEQAIRLQQLRDAKRRRLTQVAARSPQSSSEGSSDEGETLNERARRRGIRGP